MDARFQGEQYSGWVLHLGDFDRIIQLTARNTLPQCDIDALIVSDRQKKS